MNKPTVDLCCLAFFFFHFVAVTWYFFYIPCDADVKRMLNIGHINMLAGASDSSSPICSWILKDPQNVPSESFTLQLCSPLQLGLPPGFLTVDPTCLMPWNLHSCAQGVYTVPRNMEYYSVFLIGHFEIRNKPRMGITSGAKLDDMEQIG